MKIINNYFTDECKVGNEKEINCRTKWNIYLKTDIHFQKLPKPHAFAEGENIEMKYNPEAIIRSTDLKVFKSLFYFYFCDL